MTMRYAHLAAKHNNQLLRRSTLPQRDDLVIFDELIHASVHEGVRTGRATCIEARHNDVGAVETLIRTWRADGGCQLVWIRRR